MHVGQRLLRLAPLAGFVVGAVVVSSAFAEPYGPSFDPPAPPASQRLGEPDDTPHGPPESMAVWLAQRHLFGAPGAKVPPVVAVESVPAEPEIQPPALALVGTAAGDTPATSMATVRTPDGTELVSVGDTLLDGTVTVVAIAPKAILVRADERTYRVRLGARLPEYRPATRPGRSALPDSARTGVRAVGLGRYEIDVKKFERYAEEIGGKQPPDIQPFEHEGLQRVQFRTVDPSSPFALLGLRSGDIVMAVNGREVADFGTFAEATGDIEATKRLNLTVQRQGRSVTLAYRFLNTD